MTKEELVEDIKRQLSRGEELRDVARRHGMSCRAICRLLVKPTEEASDVLDLLGVDLGDPLGPSEADNIKFEYD